MNITKGFGKKIGSNQWVIGEDGIVNSRFGSVKVIEVLDDGKPLYDGINVVEGPGAVALVIDMENPYHPRIAFVVQERHGVIETDFLEKIWDKGVPDIFDPEIQAHMGVSYPELPRGFNLSTDILSEGEEETRRKLQFVAMIGYTNPNTAIMGTSPRIIVAEATSIPTDREPDPHEKIKEVIWMTPEEIRKADFLCGLTESALWKFRKFCRTHPEKSWRMLGERL